VARPGSPSKPLDPARRGKKIIDIEMSNRNSPLGGLLALPEESEDPADVAEDMELVRFRPGEAEAGTLCASDLATAEDDPLNMGRPMVMVLPLPFDWLLLFFRFRLPSPPALLAALSMSSKTSSGSFSLLPSRSMGSKGVRYVSLLMMIVAHSSIIHTLRFTRRRETWIGEGKGADLGGFKRQCSKGKDSLAVCVIIRYSVAHRLSDSGAIHRDGGGAWGRWQPAPTEKTGAEKDKSMSIR